MGEDSDHHAGWAVHTYQTCVRLERAYVQIAADCGWRTPVLGQCCQVCELRTADQVAFYTWQSLLHATALPIDGLHLDMGFPVDYVHGEIRAESLNCPRPNKQFHSTHTHTHTHVLLLPSAPCWRNLKVTAYVQIPALHDTLAEKHVTRILKCFTISAALCSIICAADRESVNNCRCSLQFCADDCHLGCGSVQFGRQVQNFRGTCCFHVNNGSVFCLACEEGSFLWNVSTFLLDSTLSHLHYLCYAHLILTQRRIFFYFYFNLH